MSAAIHVAITRRIKPGCEGRFQEALRDFFRDSFDHPGVHGASMLAPAPGSESREFGILRTFASRAERDAFYASTMFQAWESRIAELIDGQPERRELHGLEAWFRHPMSPPPPRWKMALLTFLAVWPVSMAVPAALHPLFAASVPNVIFAGAVAAGIVLVLTWVAMPLITRAVRPWLHS